MCGPSITNFVMSRTYAQNGLESLFKADENNEQVLTRTNRTHLNLSRYSLFCAIIWYL